MSSILERFALYADKTPFTPIQQEQTQSLGQFVQGASDAYALAGMVAAPYMGGFAKLGVLKILGPAEGILARYGSQALANSVRLGMEAFTFEGVQRSLRVGIGKAEASLLSWEGSGGFKKGLFHSALGFGFLKSAHLMSASQNPLFRHFLADAAMLAGNQAAAHLGLIAKAQGSLIQQFVAADVLNWQMKAGLSLVHGAFPALGAMERSLDLSIRSQENKLSPLFVSPEFAMAGNTGSCPVDFASEETKLQHTSRMAMDESGGGVSASDMSTPLAEKLERYIADHASRKLPEALAAPERRFSPSSVALTVRQALENYLGESHAKTEAATLLLEMSAEEAVQVLEAIDQGKPIGKIIKGLRARLKHPEAGLPPQAVEESSPSDLAPIDLADPGPSRSELKALKRSLERYVALGAGLPLVLQRHQRHLLLEDVAVTIAMALKNGMVASGMRTQALGDILVYMDPRDALKVLEASDHREHHKITRIVEIVSRRIERGPSVSDPKQTAQDSPILHKAVPLNRHLESLRLFTEETLDVIEARLGHEIEMYTPRYEEEAKHQEGLKGLGQDLLALLHRIYARKSWNSHLLAQHILREHENDLNRLAVQNPSIDEFLNFLKSRYPMPIASPALDPENDSTDDLILYSREHYRRSSVFLGGNYRKGQGNAWIYPHFGADRQWDSKIDSFDLAPRISMKIPPRGSKRR